jgi:hypothetical protein
MARNRKNEALRVGPVALAVALCALFAGLGLGYVWYKDQIDVLAQQVKAHEVRLGNLQSQNKMQRDQLAILCSPGRLDARVKQMKLGLGPTDLAQVIRLVDAPDCEQAAKAPSPPPPQDPRTIKMALAVRKN